MKASTVSTRHLAQRRRLLLGAAACLWRPALAAPAWPQRPVRLIVPTPAGGPSDVVARLVGQGLAGAWGQSVVVENRPGAAGALAAQAVLSAVPDGHTLLWVQASMAGLPMVQKQSPYRSLAEFTPVARMLHFGYALFASTALPVRTVPELQAWARQHPGQLNYATGTLGEFMVGVHVLSALGVQAERVPYKGGAQLMPDLMSGQVQLNCGPILSGLQHVRAGKLRALAVMLPQRSPLLPDVPTAAELGVPSADLPTWNAVVAPPGLPRELAARLAADLSAAVASPAVRDTLEQQGASAAGGTPAQLAQAIDSATDAWRSFVRTHDIAAE
ncbi:tripartite tricarboxylate transporter substrate binding protein [Ideonella sp. DXS22W]|uniref:Tripartite tricarboxylate transporter substrate binding protein n=1 Tax=Pseudaquabacterium inlustre TaxID=2984192 RepID=A0ABU9CDY8_9BURK